MCARTHAKKMNNEYNLRYRCHDIHPIGGVKANPLSNAFTVHVFCSRK